MSDKPDADADAKPKAKGGPMKKLILALALLGVGGGGAYGMMAAGLIGHAAAGKEDDQPKLVRKGDKDPFAPASAEGKGEAAAGPEVHGEGGGEYRTAYYSFSDEFTTNLRNSSALLQVGLACSTRRDGRVLAWLKTHELAIRSELLAVLADTPEEDIATVEGKQRLSRRLTAAINKVLIAQEGFGGVDAVYYRTFIVQ